MPATTRQCESLHENGIRRQTLRWRVDKKGKKTRAGRTEHAFQRRDQKRHDVDGGPRVGTEDDRQQRHQDHAAEVRNDHRSAVAESSRQ